MAEDFLAKIKQELAADANGDDESCFFYGSNSDRTKLKIRLGRRRGKASSCLLTALVLVHFETKLPHSFDDSIRQKSKHQKPGASSFSIHSLFAQRLGQPVHQRLPHFLRRKEFTEFGKRKKIRCSVGKWTRKLH